MEIASLARYAFIKKAESDEQKKLLLFFFPCEELKGGSIFTKLSTDLNVVQPYIQKIDPDLIELINRKIRNIHYYLKNDGPMS